MEIVTSFVAGFRLIVGVLYPPVKKKYFDQPKIYPTFHIQRSIKLQDRLSNNNPFNNGPIPQHEAIYFYDLKWTYLLNFRNNSEHVAYNLKILSPQVSSNFKLSPVLDSLQPVLPNNSVPYELTYQEKFESTGSDATKRLKKTRKLFEQSDT